MSNQSVKEMKRKRFNVFLVALVAMAAVLNTGCSNEVGLATDDLQGQTKIDSCQVSINLVCDNQTPEQTVVTRSGAVAPEGRVLTSSVANAGDGLEVLTQVMEDAKPQTRAGEVVVPAPAQDYTILAYQNGVKKAEWKGHFDGSKFTANGSNVQSLQPGKYLFYGFSNHMTFTDGKIVTNLSKGSKFALFSVAEKEIKAQKEDRVELTLASPFARVRVKIEGFSGNAFDGPTNGVIKYKANTVVPYTLTMDPALVWLDPSNPKAGITYTKATQDGELRYYGFTTNTEDDYDSTVGVYKKSYIITQEDGGCFFLPTTLLNQMSFQFTSDASGTIYNKPVKDRVLPLANVKDVELKAGHSYTIKQTVYYTAKYLSDDYQTVATLATIMKSGHKPVALVVDEDRHLCMGLEDVPGKKKWSVVTTMRNAESEKQELQGLQNYLNNGKDGDYLTWDENATTNVGVMKWRKQKGRNPGFEAFFALKNYKDAGEEKWFMPSIKDWAAALKYFGIDDPTQGFTFSTQQQLQWGGEFGYQLLQILFYQAGGSPLYDWYWTANDWNNFSWKNAATVTANKNGAFFGSATKTSSTLVRPFVKY